MLTGRIKLMTGVTSYCFIAPDRGQGQPRGDVFAHATWFVGFRPEHDARVEFEMGEHNGRPCAVNVRLLEHGPNWVDPDSVFSSPGAMKMLKA